MFGKTLGYCRYIHSNTAVSKIIGLFLAAAVLVFSLCFLAMAFSAAPLIVTKLADTNDGKCNADCSLREAIAAAATDDIVEFASGLTGTITLGSTLTISRNVTITGPETKSISISGNDSVRVFYIGPGINFTMKNLIVMKGRISGTRGAQGKLCETAEAGGSAEGGGLYNDKGIVNVVNSIFTGNRAIAGMGGIGQVPPPFKCASGTKSGMGGHGYGGAIYSSGTIALVHSTFLDNEAQGGKGGSSDTRVSGGAGGNGLGGALYITGDGFISNCTFYKNAAVGGAASASPYSEGAQGGEALGGALYSTAAVNLINSTFSANRAKGGTGGNTGYSWFAPGPYGSVVWMSFYNAGDGGNGNGGAAYLAGNTWIGNCTFSDNFVLAGAPGGQFKEKSHAVGLGGAIYRPGAFLREKTWNFNKSSVITLKNTLIANSSSGGNCEASIVSEGYNIDSDGSCALTAPGDLSKIDPKLEPLKQNGGNTFTHALLPSSPAIDAGNPAGCTDHNGVLISTDQRGRNRSGRCDIGAFEFSR